ncbi:DUF4352 domain-containing protein [Nonomuraea sp. ZG12]|uniref:DUF4352 domain-containing protein n=1 Tax=Nonomuraea sp. ZG12 TaxID=3452207 RepID=UPI003F8A6A21
MRRSPRCCPARGAVHDGRQQGAGDRHRCLVGRNGVGSGKFVVATVTFKIVSKTPQKYHIQDSSAHLRGPDGTEYQPDSWTSSGANSDLDNRAADGINPGLSAPVVLVFDIPKEVRPAGLVVFATEGSAGTSFRL